MTDSRYIPDWLKVKAAALLGVGTPFAASFLDVFNPVLDLLLKVGQVAVVTFTVLYTYSNWQKSRKKK